MHRVKVRRTGISEQQAAAAIERGLRDGSRAEPDGAREVRVRKGASARAKITMREESDGTAFEVRGVGLPIPLLIFTLALVNDRGIARRATEVLSRSDAFRN